MAAFFLSTALSTTSGYAQDNSEILERLAQPQGFIADIVSRCPNY